MDPLLLKSIVVNEVEHIVGTMLQEELANLQKNMSLQEASINSQIVAIFKAQLTDAVKADPLACKQMMHDIIAGTLIALAESSCGIELGNATQPSGLLQALQNAYTSIRSAFSSSSTTSK